MVTVVTKENFDREVFNYQGKVVVDFWAEWCAPCMMLGPIVEEISNENTQVKYCKVNCDNDRELAIEYGINAIPCLIAFENGEEINRSVGLVEKSDILNLTE